MKLNQLHDNPGARQNKKRVGRGIASGTGKTAGLGHKGQKARAGASIPAWFEGGQNPLYRRLPMRGFKNPFTKEFTIINLGALNDMVANNRVDASQTITLDTLIAAGFTKKGASHGLKVLGNGDVKVKLNIEAAAATQSAIDKIAKAGGKLTVLPAKPKPEGKLKPRAERS